MQIERQPSTQKFIDHLAARAQGLKRIHDLLAFTGDEDATLGTASLVRISRDGREPVEEFNRDVVRAIELNLPHPPLIKIKVEKVGTPKNAPTAKELCERYREFLSLVDAPLASNETPDPVAVAITLKAKDHTLAGSARPH